jgi:hypothetical protein
MLLSLIICIGCDSVCCLQVPLLCLPVVTPTYGSMHVQPDCFICWYMCCKQTQL